MADPAVMKRQMVMAEAVTNQKVPSASSYNKAKAAAAETQARARANAGMTPSVAKPATVAPRHVEAKMATPAAQKKAAGVQSAKAFTPARRRTTTAKKR